MSSAGLEYLDVGGGLGVDYDGSKTDFGSSINYGLQEYANDVIFHVKEICDQAGVAHRHEPVALIPHQPDVADRFADLDTSRAPSWPGPADGRPPWPPRRAGAGRPTG